MGWLKAHIVKERARGMREEVKINLFNMDDTPFEIPVIPDAPVVEAWHTIADADMVNGFTNLGAGYEVQYRKRPDNTVELRGYLKPGAPNTKAFALPAGYRPINLGLRGLVLVVPGYDSGDAQQELCSLSIGANGDVYAGTISAGVFYMNLAQARFTVD